MLSVVMVLSTCGSNKSYNSKTSTYTCKDLVVTGPVIRRGHMFAKIRRCPLCMRTNAEPSPLDWPRELEHSGQESDEVLECELLQWNHGTSLNPIGRTRKICSTVFVLGGFAHRLERLDK